MAAAFRLAFSAAGTEDAGATTQDSPSATLVAGDTVYVEVINSDNTPAAPTGCVWDPTGVNEALTKVGDQACGSFGNTTIWRGTGLTAKTGIFRATWAAAKTERAVIGVAWSGVDQTTPNGTIGTGTGTPTAVSATCSTTTGQQVLSFVHYVDTSPAGLTFNSPTGNERFENATSPQGFDRYACQDQTASGVSTTPTWTLSGASGTLNWRMFAIPINDAVSDKGRIFFRTYRPRPFGPGIAR